MYWRNVQLCFSLLRLNCILSLGKMFYNLFCSSPWSLYMNFKWFSYWLTLFASQTTTSKGRNCCFLFLFPHFLPYFNFKFTEKKITNYPHIPLYPIHLLVTFCLIIIPYFVLPTQTHPYRTYIHIFFPEWYKNVLQTLCTFMTKFFNVCFLRSKMFSYVTPVLLIK